LAVQGKAEDETAALAQLVVKVHGPWSPGFSVFGVRAGDDQLQGAQVQPWLNGLHARPERSDVIVRQHLDGFLQHDRSFVDTLGDDVDGGAAPAFTRSQYGGVNMVTVHALAAVGGQQGGVDVENAAG